MVLNDNSVQFRNLDEAQIKEGITKLEISATNKKKANRRID
jgi:hypothetical protein